MQLEIFMALAGLLLLMCVCANRISSKLGIPSLLVFLAVGMIAGSDGAGIEFYSAELSNYIGSFALSFILFSGGLETNWSSIKNVLVRGTVLATFGVALTAFFMFLLAYYVLGMPFAIALLLSVILSSTDAPAVFSILRTSGLYLNNPRLKSVLEYESGSNDPMAVILSVPCGLMGSFLFAKLFGLENNIYLQTGVIMLIGLLAKTAILITEFASERRRKGMGIIEAAYAAAQARFRPILMTVLTMIFGMLPLMFASGAGANGNSSLGTGVVGGMIVGTLALLFITPVFFVFFQYWQEKIRPAMHEEADPQFAAERERSLQERSSFNKDKEEN